MNVTLAARFWIAADAAVAAILVLLREILLFAIGAACEMAPMRGDCGTSGIASATGSAVGAGHTQVRV